MVGKKEVGTGQLLEQLGFDQQQLQTPIKDLSGGQRRRLQLLRLLFSEPNVLILDEPTNDLDTDMLAAMEDVLDSWPGTLIVVSHDRYLLERTTDNQYAMLGDGKLRHLTRGVEQYLELRKSSGTETKSTGSASGIPQVTGAEKRNLEKELARLERAVAKSHLELDELNKILGDHDPADYEGLVALGSRQKDLETKIAKSEELWLDVAQKLQLS
jgi:ATP-binding cassette subfamily F protein uup